MKAAILFLALCGLTDSDKAVRYVYSQEVAWVGRLADRLLHEGYTPRSVAIAAHKLRREIGAEAKSQTSSEMIRVIRSRNASKYGDHLGPSISYLRSRGMSWRDIAKSAGRIGGSDIAELREGVE